MSRGTAGLVALDLVEKLRPFGSSVVDKGIDVLPETFHGLSHFSVEALRLGEPRDQLAKCVVDLSVARHHHISLPRDRLVLGLLGSNPLVLQQIPVRLGQFFHQRCLLVICLDDAILVRPELLQFGLKQLVLLPAAQGFLVEDEDI